MAEHPIPNITAASIERQLGEMVGTVRMVVSGMESLKESVEKLADRAAFKGDLEATRHETKTAIEGLERDLHGTINSLRTEMAERDNAQNAKLDRLTRWITAAGGAITVLVFLVDHLNLIEKILPGR